MDLCLMLGLCYLADVSGRASVDFFPRYPCNTFGPGGFILQTSATTRHSGHRLVDDRANQQFYSTLFRLEGEAFHPPAAIHAEVQLSQKSDKTKKGKKKKNIIQYGTKENAKTATKSAQVI